MGFHQRLITEELYKRAVEQLASMNRDNRVAIRLMAIIAAKENGVGVVCKVFNITTNTLRNWVKSFAQGNDKSLEYKQGRGRKSKLTKNCYEAINKWLQDDCNMTINNIIIRLKENLAIDTVNWLYIEYYRNLNLHTLPQDQCITNRIKKLMKGLKKTSRDNNK